MMDRNADKKNFRVKLIIFIIALLFWALVKMNQVYDYTLDIPLRVIINNPEICLKYSTPKKVRVEFTGKGLNLLRLNFNTPTYDVDLSDESGNFVLNLPEHPEYVYFASNLSQIVVKSIVRPHELLFELDRRVRRKVPVKIHTELQTEPGFIWVGATAHPDSILMDGPASFIDTLTAVHLEKHKYENVNLAFWEEQEIIRSPAFFSIYKPERVNVFFDVQRLAEKVIRDVPVEVINVSPGYEAVALPSTAQLSVKGGEKILADAVAKDFRIVIDFQKEWRRDSKRVKARIDTELQIFQVESRPPEFDLIVQKKRTGRSR